jgi:hypothetical protein
MPSNVPQQSDFLTSAFERSSRLCEILEHHAADLSASPGIDPVVRDAGLAAIRRVIDCAHRLADNAQSAIGDRNIPPSSSVNSFPEAHGDE